MPRLRIAALACALSLPSLVMPAAVRAESVTKVDPATREKLKSLFKSGRAHYNLGEFREAIEDFKAAYRITPDPVFLFNIGQSQRELGDHEGALRSFQAYLRDATSPQDRADATRLIDEEEKAVAEQKARAAAAPVVKPAAGEVPAGATPAPPAEAPGRKGLWIGLGVAGGLIVAGGAVALGLLLSPPSAPDAPFGTYTADFQ